MSRPALFILFVITTCIVMLGFAMAPETSVIAQALNEPQYPVCEAGTQEVLQFGPGELLRPENLQDSFSFNVPAGAGTEGQILVWQGEGHFWDLGCNPGPDNDPDGPAACDNAQPLEIAIFSVNGDTVGQFIDHSPDDDRNYFYTFDLSNLQAGENQLVLDHLNEGNRSNSVFYKGVVCAATGATATPTSTSTPTSTPTNTPTSTPTNTPTSTPTNTPTGMPTSTSTPTNTPTSTSTLTPTPTNTPDPSDPTGLDPVDQPSESGLLDQICNTGICQFLPFVTGD